MTVTCLPLLLSNGCLHCLLSVTVNVLSLVRCSANSRLGVILGVRYMSVSIAFGGGVEYLHRRPARRRGPPYSWGI
jgi:hypothetical protein